MARQYRVRHNSVYLECFFFFCLRDFGWRLKVILLARLDMNEGVSLQE